jgi:hypothetical protein
MVNLRKSGLGYRKISDEIKTSLVKEYTFLKYIKFLTRPHNQQLLQGI